MGCQSDVFLGGDLTFSVCSHNPDAESSDADSPPVYRLYETETGTPILTGSMAKLDDANTTGFYTETVACTVANGFENGKSYTIYITGSVDGVPGAISYNFRVISKAWDDVKALHVSAGTFGSEIQAHALSSEIAALNDVSLAEINAEIANALATYDPSTGTEAGAILSAITGLNDIAVSDVMTSIVEGTLTLEQVVRIVLAFVSGETTYDEVGGVVAYRDLADSKARISMTVTEDGDRTAVTVDGS